MSPLDRLWRIVIERIRAQPHQWFLIDWTAFATAGVDCLKFMDCATPDLFVDMRPGGVYVARHEVGLRSCPILITPEDV